MNYVSNIIERELASLATLKSFDSRIANGVPREASSEAPRVAQRVIDVTPTWSALLPLLLEIAANGNTTDARWTAKAELMRMAQAADKWNAHCRATKAD